MRYLNVLNDSEPRASASGVQPRNGTRSLTARLRYSFGAPCEGLSQPQPWRRLVAALITRSPALVFVLILCCLLGGCRSEMYDQPRHEALEPSGFFRDGKSARPLVEGTIAQGQLIMDEHFYTGKQSGQLVNTFPFPITREILQRGQERFNIYCSPCHSRLGDGRGMIVQRGFQQPPSFHIPRLQEAPAGHFFDVITNGFGAMFDYAAQVSPHDRWAIIAYIRALQLSQKANLNDVPAEERERLVRAK